MSENEYWNKYYNLNSRIDAIKIPSQFSAFVLSEINFKNSIIIDFGCGNGRDSLFFAGQNIETIGIDQSVEAIKSCQKYKIKNANFIRASIEQKSLYDELNKLVELKSDKEIVIYSRFFLHSINEQQQALFLKLIHKILPSNGKVFLEFRTDKDEMLQKVTDKHYRRFINPMQFCHEVIKEKFEIVYFIEGFGYAKYKNDDAYVARFILKSI